MDCSPFDERLLPEQSAFLGKEIDRNRRVHDTGEACAGRSPREIISDSANNWLTWRKASFEEMTVINHEESEPMREAIRVFDEGAEDYDAWYDRNPELFASELAALKAAMPQQGDGVEIGAGTGRFSLALGMGTGVEPAEGMARIAEARGLRVVRAVAETLPFEDARFDYAAMITTVCFLENPTRAFAEVHRILRPGGVFVLGILSALSALGQRYASHAAENAYFRHARLYTPEEIFALLAKSGFESTGSWQTLSTADPDNFEAPSPGHDRGGFVVIRAVRPEGRDADKRENPWT